MNEDAKDFMKLAALCAIPPVFFVAAIALLVFMMGCTPPEELGYVIEDQNGTQVVCKNIDRINRNCGVYASYCDDGLERNCMTNVKIRKVEP